MNKKSKIYNIGIVYLFFCFLFPSLAVAKTDKPIAKYREKELLVKYKQFDEPELFRFETEADLSKAKAEYDQNEDVEYTEANYVYESAIIPNDTNATNQWYFKKVKAFDAWDVIRESKDITVAVIDSGVQIDHPDLKDNIWRNKKEIPGNKIDDDRNGFIDDVNGWDFVSASADPSPKFDEGYTENGVFHGTVIAGILGASGNNAAGVAGITWKVGIMPLRVLDGKGEGSTSKVVKAIDYAVKNGADIINLSFVGFGYSRSIEDAIKRAYDAGVIVVAAAGNEQADGAGYNIDDVPMYPACNDGPDGENRVIGVAALDTIDQKAKFSSYGSRCVDISAPGVGIFSTTVYSADRYIDGHAINKYYDGYWSGTSMAAPMVAGAMALIEQVNPRLDHNEVADMLFKYSDDIVRLNPDYLGKLGSGRLNVFLSTHFAEKRLVNYVNKLFYSPASSFSTTSKVFVLDSEKRLTSFAPYGVGYRGAIVETAADVDADGYMDIIIAPGAGSSGQLKIFDHHFKPKTSFKVSPDKYKGGINLGAGDLNKDGRSEIVVAPLAGDIPLVKVFASNGEIISQFFAYDKNFKGGVNLAVGDVDGDGYDEIITAPGKTGGPQVKVFKMNGKLQNQFFVYDKGFRGGVKVATAHINYGASGNRDRIIVSPASSGGPHIRIYNSTGALEGQFFAYDKSFRGGVNVSAGDLDKDGLDELITGVSSGGAPHVRVFDANVDLVSSFYAFDQSYQGGVNIFANK